MTMSRRLRLVATTAILAATALIAQVGWHTPKAEAFFVIYHDRLVRDALPADQVDETAIRQILVGPPPGAGAMGTDAFTSDAFRHIDSAPTPADICARTAEAWNFFTPLILNGSQLFPTGLADGAQARAAFGGLAHALQDFYAHSNWVEDNIAIGQLDRLPPELMPACDPAALPPNLYTGYFSVEYGLSGCPPAGPPPGFAECHTTLNKDSPYPLNAPRGATPIPGTNMNYFDLAMQLAARDTTELYHQVRGLVASVNGGDAAACLFNTGIAGCGDPGPVLELDWASLGPHGLELPDVLASWPGN